MVQHALTRHEGSRFHLVSRALAPLGAASVAPNRSCDLPARALCRRVVAACACVVSGLPPRQCPRQGTYLKRGGVCGRERCAPRRAPGHTGRQMARRSWVTGGACRLPRRRGRPGSSRDRRVIRSRGRGVPGSQGSWPPGRRGRARSSHHPLAAGGVCVRCACVVRGCLLRCAIVVKRCRASRGPPESCFVACGSSHISATGSTAATQPPAFWSWRTSSSKVSVNRSTCVHSQSPTGV